MTDINTPLSKAYFDALNNAITVSTVTGFVKVYNGEEPDNVQDQCYIVIGEVVSSDASTKSSSDTRSSIQVGIYTWENKYNTAKTANSVAEQVYSLIKSGPNSILDISASGMQMMNLTFSDRTETIGTLAGRKYINRIIVFQQDIFIGQSIA